jgi:hypothetical protein
MNRIGMVTLLGAGMLAMVALDNATATGAEMPMAPMALNGITNPPSQLASARVMDDHGVLVGAVQKVTLDAAGTPTQVDVALLGSQQIVALAASQFSYDQSNNLLTAGMDKSQIMAAPAAPQG